MTTERVDLREFVGAFVAETDELVISANALLLEIERGNASGASRPRAVRDLFRALHTIKGLAGMIGVEPIVEIAHALEALLRTADRAGGTLQPVATELCLQGVAAIGERVRAIAERGTPEAAPERLLQLIAATESGDPVPLAVPLVSAWHARLGPSERQQLSTALLAGGHAWAVSYAPSEANAARGITIASVRAALANVGDILKVQPRATPGEVSSVVFDLLVVSDADPAAIAEAAGTTVDRLVPVLAEQTARTAIVDEAPAPAIGRALVRVELARLDDLQDQLSLLIVSRFRLEREIAAQAAAGHDMRRLREVADLQGRQLRDLRRAILRARMVRVAEVLEPLPLLVRGLARTAQREVRIEIDARDAELDKAVADRLLPALVHLIRNAVDHGFEEDRVALGKPRTGTVRVTCRELGANRLELVVADDGRGIDRAAIAVQAGRSIDDDRTLLDVLVMPGFSTVGVATRTSGRGLGMDIVHRIAVDMLGGELELATTLGVGTVFTLRVPLTIAVIEVFSFECGSEAFAVPVSSIEEIFELAPDEEVQPPHAVGARAPARILQHRGHAVSVLALGAVLSLEGGRNGRKAMVTRCRGERVAFAVDRMLGRHEVVVRRVDDPLVRVPGVAGATDLGTGRPTLVLDFGALELGAA